MSLLFPSEPKTVLVAASHPDDEVLGCGATMARLAEEGHRVHVLILGEGISSRYGRRSRVSRKELTQLRTDAKAAARILGVRSVSFDRFPDNRFDELPLLGIVKRVEKCLADLKPELVFTHHPGDLNVDHRMTFQAVLTATRPVLGCRVKELYAFEIPSSTEWAFQQFQPVFKPNLFVDVSTRIRLKIRAMESYRSEVRRFPHPRSPEALLALARRWGSVVGVHCAEAFDLVRSVR